MSNKKYQFLPDLLPEEYDAQKASIVERGVEVPIIVDQDGNTIDGFNREQICGELGISCPKEVRHFDCEADKFELALRLNCRRRQLNRKQKRDLISVYLTRDPQIADNHLAEIIGGVSKNTVAEIRKQLEATRQIDKFETLRGKDGKDRPRKYKRIIANTPNETKTALRIVSDLPDNCEGKTLDITTAKRRVNRHIQKDARDQKKASVPSVQRDDLTLLHCPFQSLEEKASIKPDSVDLVFTDFPYDKTFLPQLAELAEFSARILKEGGLLVSYSGQYYLDAVMNAFGNHLTYRWMCASTWNGDGNLNHQRNVIGKWKPIVVFSKGDWKKRANWVDVSHVESKEKLWHPWQQPLAEVEFWLRQFSEPGELVVDPCSGGFTTAVASLRNNRRFIGCDIDQKCVEAGHQRLASEMAKSEGAA
jgi:DNA methylase